MELWRLRQEIVEDLLLAVGMCSKQVPGSVLQM